MKKHSKKLSLLVIYGARSHGPVIIRSLQKTGDVYSIRIENDLNQIYQNRYQRYGYLKGFGQKLFIKYSSWLKRRSRIRIDEIKEEFGLDDSPIKPTLTINSIHDNQLPERIRSLNPDLIVLNCASIIPEDLLKAVTVPFLNLHGGITPLYRGIYGAYWALREGNPHLVGSTIHLVDEGIDTGDILNQTCFRITEADNFSTYNYLHLAYALRGLHEVIQYYRTYGQLPDPVNNDLESGIRTHPTLPGYLFHRLFRGIK